MDARRRSSETALAKRKDGSMKVGCVKEIKQQEYRVGMTPDTAKSYVRAGNEVLVERHAGEGSGFTDEQYEKAGAVLVDRAEQVWERSDMIVKVKEPLPDEYGYFREGQILYAYLHLAAERALTEALVKSKVKAVAFETLSDEAGRLPLLAPMSQIAGRLSVQEGAKYLEKTYGGRGVLLSGVPGVERARVVIVGAGSVGTAAAKIAMGMGAQVSILDVNVARLEYLDDLFGPRIQTLVSNDAAIESCLASADLTIGAVLIPGKAAPKLIKRSYLSHMHPGSVIVDVAVDQGGCCETTKVTYHDDPVYAVDGVVHYCVGNMPGAVPRTSTIALSNATLGYGLRIASVGLEEAVHADERLYSAVNVYDGAIVCENVATSLGMEAHDARSVIG